MKKNKLPFGKLIFVADSSVISTIKEEMYKEFLHRFEYDLDTKIQKAVESSNEVKRIGFEIQSLKDAWFESLKAKGGIFVHKKSRIDIKLLKSLGDLEMTEKVCPICNGFLCSDLNRKIYVCNNCQDYWKEFKMMHNTKK